MHSSSRPCYPPNYPTGLVTGHVTCGCAQPIREDEFGRLDIGDLDVWLWSRTVAPDTHKDAFITSLWSIFLTIGRWEVLVDGANWALPVADHLRNNILARWAWQDGSDTNHVDPSLLARWLGTHVGVTPDRARDFLEPYARRHERDVYYSHTAQAAHNRVQSKRDWKTLMASTEGPRHHTFRGRAQLFRNPHTQSGWQPDYLRHRYLVPPPLLMALWPWMRTLRRCHRHRYPPTSTPNGRGRRPCHQHCW